MSTISFFFKQKTAYEMRISDGSSDVCSSDLRRLAADPGQPLVTFYDDTSGERTELSVKTYANWVSKTANLYVDEDRKSVVSGTSVSVRVDLGGRRIIKKKQPETRPTNSLNTN